MLNVSFTGTNFEIIGGIEKELKKVGLKFGVTLKDVKTISIEKIFTEGNDVLGSGIINFADNIIVSLGLEPNSNLSYYNVRDYSDGFFTMSILPKKVQ